LSDPSQGAAEKRIRNHLHGIPFDLWRIKAE